MSLISAPSPNFDQRRAPPDMIVLHYTGMESGAAALERLRDPEAKVSAHYMVEEDGRVFQLVPEERRAWHAGVSFWKGERDVNGASIGIELVNPGHEFGYPDFPDIQVEALIGLLDAVRGRWTSPTGASSAIRTWRRAARSIPARNSPGKRLALDGHGLWIEADPAPGAPLGLGDEGTGVFALQAGLTRLGYDSAPSGQYDDHTQAIVTAFQRHWRPERVDGIADGETRARLVRLLRRAAEEQ